jgi:Predicted nucleotide-binding protein containing TIR-like domain
MPADVLKAAKSLVDEVAPLQQGEIALAFRTVDLPDETWDLDSDDEFFADYKRPDVEHAYFQWRGVRVVFWLTGLMRSSTEVSVELPTRELVERVFALFDEGADRGRLPAPQPDPVVFIGHGHSEDWKAVRDFLRDRAGCRAQSFETRPRAGETVTEALDELARSSSAAAIVHTGEDETATGLLRARQNVVHETGFFQAHLGFGRVVILREQETEEFSNLAGLQELRYARGNVAAIMGELHAVLDREFPNRVRHRN